MMCCEPCGPSEEPNGVCPDCGEPTFDGESINQCGYSKVECETCNHAPCDGSC